MNSGNTIFPTDIVCLRNKNINTLHTEDDDDDNNNINMFINQPKMGRTLSLNVSCSSRDLSLFHLMCTITLPHAEVKASFNNPSCKQVQQWQWSNTEFPHTLQTVLRQHSRDNICLGEFLGKFCL